MPEGAFLKCVALARDGTARQEDLRDREVTGTCRRPRRHRINVDPGFLDLRARHRLCLAVNGGGHSTNSSCPPRREGRRIAVPHAGEWLARGSRSTRRAPYGAACGGVSDTSSRPGTPVPSVPSAVPAGFPFGCADPGAFITSVLEVGTSSATADILPRSSPGGEMLGPTSILPPRCAPPAPASPPTPLQAPSILLLTVPLPGPRRAIPCSIRYIRGLISVHRVDPEWRVVLTRQSRGPPHSPR